MHQFTFLLLTITILLTISSACKPSPEKPMTESTTTPTSEPNPDDHNPLQNFGKNYAAAWCSQKPEQVAAFFAADGSLKVNDAAPAVGREAITKVAQGFMTAFPDMVVSMDSLIGTNTGASFHWTLTGTNTGPNGTGKSVRVSGVEQWQFNNEGLINQSIGSFDADEYNRQLKYGVK
jgi:hypothetical protein